MGSFYTTTNTSVQISTIGNNNNKFALEKNVSAPYSVFASLQPICSFKNLAEGYIHMQMVGLDSHYRYISAGLVIFHYQSSNLSLSYSEWVWQDTPYS